MNNQQHANAGHGSGACRPVAEGGLGHDAPPNVRSASSAGVPAKTTQHQVREIHRLVDGAMEDLEQVLRALRYLEQDV